MSDLASLDRSAASVSQAGEDEGTLSRYYYRRDMRFVREIASGGMSRVLLFNLDIDGNQRRVAVKTLSRKSVTIRELRHLRLEAKILTSIRHENIIRIYGIAETECGFGLVLEYFPNGSYKDFFKDLWLQRDRHELEEEIVPLKIRIIAEVVSAMEYLHLPRKFPHLAEEKRILHLDLKSDNVLLDQNLHAKICDFGLGMMSTLTRLRTGTSEYRGAYGTPGFVAPERLKDENSKPTTKCDVYAFGILQYEIITDSPPYPDFDPKNLRLLEHYIAEKECRPDVSQISPMFPIVLVDLMRDCWSQYPEARPSFQELSNRMIDIKNSIDDFDRNATESVHKVKSLFPNDERLSIHNADDTLPDLEPFSRSSTRDERTRNVSQLGPIFARETIVKTVIPVPIVADCTDDALGEIESTEFHNVAEPQVHDDEGQPLLPTGFNLSPHIEVQSPICSNGEVLRCVYMTVTLAAVFAALALVLKFESEKPGCRSISKEDYSKMSCTDEKYPTCSFSCQPPRIMQGKSVISCLGNGSWSAPAPFCLCPKCHFGDNCEYSNDWNDVADSLADIQHTSPVTVNYGWKKFKCNASEYTASFKWIAHCVDDVRIGTTETCVDDNSASVAATAAAAKLIKVLAKQGSYPVPCDSSDMPHKCEKLRQYI